ncbi:MAG: amidohydrolase, partial [Anaerolineae bacterium]|nr:amidohydrolase [Anaerolineae bacterium]
LVAPGPVMAGAESFSVTIAGKGGHGALPHLSVDPILAASHIVTALQSIASRSIDPLDSVVVSVTAIHGGDAFNVIPPQVELKGTVRAFSAQVKRDLLQRFHEIVEGIATSMGCSAQIIFDEITPPVVNDAALAARIARLSQGLFPDDVLDTESRTMGSEDMAFMMGDIPGCFFFVGSNNSEKGLDAGHHHPKFDFDERALVRAVALMATAAADILTDTQRQLDE